MREESPELRRRRLWILAGLWAAILAVLVVFRGVVLPFAAAALIAYLLAPIVDRLGGIQLQRRHLPRWAAILVIYAIFFVLVYLAIFALVPQLYREVVRLSREAVDFANSLTPERIQQLAEQADAWLRTHGIPLSLSGGESQGMGLSFDMQQMIRTSVSHAVAAVQERLGDIVSLSRSLVAAALAAVFMLFFTLMVAAFFSVDALKIRAYVKTLIPTEASQDARDLLERMDRALSGVVRGQFTICLINGALTLAGLLLFGVKFAFVLATLATFFSLIPVFGTIISSVPIVTVALTQGLKPGFAMLGWIVGIHVVEAYVLNPKIMGSAARIHPIVVAFALFAGERTFGIVGALFAVPSAAIAVACFDFARLKARG